MILIEGFTHADGLYTAIKGAVAFVVFLILVRAAYLLVDLVLWKEYPVLQYSLILALLFGLLTWLAQTGLPQSLCVNIGCVLQGMWPNTQALRGWEWGTCGLVQGTMHRGCTVCKQTYRNHLKGKLFKCLKYQLISYRKLT